jgi:hypothetical protein
MPWRSRSRRLLVILSWCLRAHSVGPGLFGWLVGVGARPARIGRSAEEDGRLVVKGGVRYELIQEVIDPALTARQRGELVRRARLDVRADGVLHDVRGVHDAAPGRRVHGIKATIPERDDQLARRRARAIRLRR